jgi:hypothetical protein
MMFIGPKELSDYWAAATVPFFRGDCAPGQFICCKAGLMISALHRAHICLDTQQPRFYILRITTLFFIKLLQIACLKKRQTKQAALKLLAAVRKLLIAELKKAQKEDFEAVYPFLQDMNPHAAIAKETWKRIFDPPWAGKEDYCGYLLMDHGRVVGFLGYIFCTREINGRAEKFCSVTTWNVEEKYRGQSMSLLHPFLSLEGYTLVNFSPSVRVNEIFKKLDFSSLEIKHTILYPNPFALLMLRHNSAVIYDGSGFEALLGEREKRIYADHKPCGCIHALIRSDIGDCYLVMSRFKKKRLPFLAALHISDIDVFRSCCDGVLPGMLFRLKAAYMHIDERLLKGRTFRNSFSRMSDVEKLYLSDSLDPGNIDNLYSELPLLGLM